MNGPSMTDGLRRHVRHNAVAYLALMIALGGTSYAAGLLPPNSVGPQQLQHDAVSSPKVADQSLLAKDFAPGQLPRGERGANGKKGKRGGKGRRGARGLLAPTGARGSTGAAGLAGAAGLSGPIGPQGPQGPQGDPGATGAPGPAGADGTDGAPGSNGVNGNNGTPGAQGDPGPSVGGGNVCFDAQSGLTATCSFQITAPTAGFLVMAGRGQAVVADKDTVCDGDPGAFQGFDLGVGRDGAIFVPPVLSRGAIVSGESYPLADVATMSVTAGLHTVTVRMNARVGNCTSQGTDPTFSRLSVTAVFVEGP